MKTCLSPNHLGRAAASLALCWCLAAGAQDEGPTAAPAVPFADAGPATAPAVRQDLRDAPAAEDGTTIVGERESPIGLYITPWRNAYAEQDIDRPARLLRVDLTPVDRTVLARQVEYYEALSAAANGKGTPTSAAPASSKP